MGYSPYILQAPTWSSPVEYADKAVINIEPVRATNEGLAFLFDPDAGLLLVSDHKVMDLQHGLVQEAHRFPDRLLVNFDEQCAQELVEVIFEAVLFRFSDFNGVLHRLFAFNSALQVPRARTVPLCGRREASGVGYLHHRRCPNSDQWCLNPLAAEPRCAACGG